MGQSMSRNQTGGGGRRSRQQRQSRGNPDRRHSRAPLALPSSTPNPTLTTHQLPPPSSSSSSNNNVLAANSHNTAHATRSKSSGSRGFAPAKKIKNDVNVHKDSIRITADENDSESFLVSFTFDALVDGSITIFYFAKEGVNCSFTPIYPEYYTPTKIPFQKGLGQKYVQPPGTGIGLGFFEMNELTNSTAVEDIFPLVIYLETHFPPSTTDVECDQTHSTTSPHAQITQAVLDETKEGRFHVRVIKQILWIDEVCYELHELYGIGHSTDKSGFDDSEPGRECVICMMKPKDTVALPCRHMCMCSDCAKALRVQSNKCPICRQLIQELIMITIDKGEE